MAEAVAYGTETLQWALMAVCPGKTSALLDTAIRVHVVEGAPTSQIADDLDCAWWPLRLTGTGSGRTPTTAVRA
jgi:hypothetical protein